MNITKTILLALFLIEACVFLFGFAVGLRNGYNYLKTNNYYFFSNLLYTTKSMIISGLTGGVIVMSICNMGLLLYVYNAVSDFFRSKTKK